jgi:hypothetical protein
MARSQNKRRGPSGGDSDKSSQRGQRRIKRQRRRVNDAYNNTDSDWRYSRQSDDDDLDLLDSEDDFADLDDDRFSDFDDDRFSDFDDDLDR